MRPQVEEIECVEVSAGSLLEDVRALLGAYALWIEQQQGGDAVTRAQGMNREIDELPGEYARPAGRLFALTVNGLVAGCVALRTLEPQVGEVKRLFVAPGYRGNSHGARLLEYAIEAADGMRLRTLRLDTLPFMASAMRLYRQHGFVERGPYSRDPLAGMRHFERAIEAQVPTASLIAFRPEYAADFERINRIWLEEFFHVEDKDLAVFRDPQASVVTPGGEIFFVREEDQLVGSCSVMCHGDGEYELAKMAVDRHARGRGYGEWLVRAAIAFAREHGATRLFLLSDEQLRDALRLYERLGFRRVPFPRATGYQRGDVMMEYPL